MDIDFSKVVLIPSDQLVAFAFICAFAAVVFNGWLEFMVSKIKKWYYSRKN